MLHCYNLKTLILQRIFVADPLFVALPPSPFLCDRHPFLYCGYLFIDFIFTIVYHKEVAILTKIQ